MPPAVPRRPAEEPRTAEEALALALEVLYEVRRQIQEHSQRVPQPPDVVIHEMIVDDKRVVEVMELPRTLVVYPETILDEVERGLATLARWRPAE